MIRRIQVALLALVVPVGLFGCGGESADVSKPEVFKEKLEEAGKAAEIGKASLKAEKGKR
ncbi:MAG: hypothetical protein SFX72_15635 [Isosphaeraceae bacterium]|nr:hypothetical protein [Isosphaeraceae bacterium]